LQKVGYSLQGLPPNTSAEELSLRAAIHREPSEQLKTLKRDLCFEEAFQRCRHTGDFSHLGTVIYSHFRQLELFGEPSPDDIELAHIYLERCGLWDLTIESVEDIRVADPRGPVTGTYHLKRTYPIRWHPGPGLYGILGVHPKGEGATEDAEAGYSAPWAVGCQDVGMRYVATAPLDTVEIHEVRFDQRPPVVTTQRVTTARHGTFEVRIVQSDDDPIPRDITLDLSFGLQDWREVGEECRHLSTATASAWSGNYLLFALGNTGFLDRSGAQEVGATATYKDWVFDTDPFKATMTVTKTFADPYVSPLLPVSVSVEMIVTLEHTPAN
jgi:hypothetical protein